MRINATAAPRCLLPPSGINARVGSIIRAQRLIREMSQTDLADAVRGRSGRALTFQAIQRYEKGTVEIPLSNLEQIADVLGIAITDFITAVTEPMEKFVSISSHTMKLALAIDRSTPAVRKAIRILLDDTEQDGDA